MEFRIKEILDKKGMTATSLCEAVGITKQNMSNINRGKQNPSLALLEQIAKVLDVEIWELFQRSSEINSNINGFVEINGEIYRIKTNEDLLRLVEIL